MSLCRKLSIIRYYFFLWERSLFLPNFLSVFFFFSTISLLLLLFFLWISCLPFTMSLVILWVAHETRPLRSFPFRLRSSLSLTPFCPPRSVLIHLQNPHRYSPTHKSLATDSSSWHLGAFPPLLSLSLSLLIQVQFFGTLPAIIQFQHPLKSCLLFLLLISFFSLYPPPVLFYTILSQRYFAFWKRKAKTMGSSQNCIFCRTTTRHLIISLLLLLVSSFTQVTFVAEGNYIYIYIYSRYSRKN